MKTIIILLASFAAAMLVSCDDNSTAPSPEVPGTSYTGPTAFFTKHAPLVQVFDVDAVAGTSFTGSKGTQVSFPPNAFVDANNNPVTGNVTVKFRELYDKKDMLLS